MQFATLTLQEKNVKIKITAIDIVRLGLYNLFKLNKHLKLTYGKKMARPRIKHNIAWVANAADVSIATVSNTINNRPGVSEKTRREVQKIIAESEYRRSCRNVGLKTICVVTGGLGSWYVTDCISGIIEYASEADINVNTIICSPKQNKPLLEQLRISRCDGIIVLPPGLVENDLRTVIEMNVPVMIADDFSPVDNIGYINNDSYQGSYDLAHHLIGLNHKNIAYLSYRSQQQQNTQARINGWRDAMCENGFDKKNLTNLFYTAGYSDIAEVIKRIIKEHCELTALMVVDDHMALAALQACHKLGLRIPEDISITGFDDIFDAQYYYPALTTAQHSGKKIARKITEKLKNIMDGNNEEQIVRELVPVKIIIRQSTGPARSS